jgi:hypothetical protein
MQPLRALVSDGAGNAMPGQEMQRDDGMTTSVTITFEPTHIVVPDFVVWMLMIGIVLFILAVVLIWIFPVVMDNGSVS